MAPEKYSESFKKVDTKTIIPIGDTFSFVQDLKKTKNKYNSNDYRILAGAEFSPFSFFSVESGLESNFRSLDQNPTSRKFYFNPALKLGSKVSLSFINKYNPYSGSSDHDLSLSISPFKSKVLDFGVYSGLTRSKDGATSESVSFSTNFYFR